MRDIETERAEIERAIGGKTLCSVFAETAARYPSEPALSWRSAEGWQSLSWSQYRARVAEATVGLRAIGLTPGRFALIMTRNRPEHVIADLAIVHNRGTSVSLYNTLAPEQVAYIAGHCEAEVAVLEDAGFLDKFRAVRDRLPHLKRVVLIDAAGVDDDGWTLSWDEMLQSGRDELAREASAFDDSWHEVQPDDLATLIYTSGTTGPPKGVMDPHHQILWMCHSSATWLARPPGGRHISYLPFAHAFERFIGHWYAIYAAQSVYFCPDPAQLFAYAAELKPNDMIGVPRVWEKLHAALSAGIQAEPDSQKRDAVKGAIAIGREVVKHRQRLEPLPAELQQQAEQCRPVWKALLAKVGLDECEVAITGAAPINVAVIEFFQALGLPLVEGYGMTETTVGATFSPQLDEHRNGTVGQADFGVEIKLAEDGELLVRGGNVTRGYYKEPDKTAETIDADGWLHTGDVAQIDEDGYVKIVDRKKELIITAGGKNISPANLENLLKQHPLVGQACVIGDRRPYITALVVLDAEVPPGWARSRGITTAGLGELAQHPDLVTEVQDAVAAANEHVSRVEQVKRFSVLPVEWTAESEELTPTLKLKRRVISSKYQTEIEGMYASPPLGYEPAAGRATAAAVN